MLMCRGWVTVVDEDMNRYIFLIIRFFLNRGRRCKDAEARMVPMLDVSTFALVSQCSTRYLVMLISAMVNVEHLITGSSTEFDDAALVQILVNNRLARLSELKVAHSEGLTIKSVYLLLEECSRLSSVREMDYWERVSKLVSNVPWIESGQERYVHRSFRIYTYCVSTSATTTWTSALVTTKPTPSPPPPPSGVRACARSFGTDRQCLCKMHQYVHRND